MLVASVYGFVLFASVRTGAIRAIRRGRGVVSMATGVAVAGAAAVLVGGTPGAAGVTAAAVADGGLVGGGVTTDGAVTVVAVGVTGCA